MIRSLAAGAALAVLLAGCGGAEGSPEPEPSAGENRPIETSEPSDPGEGESEPMSFGDTYTWDDGLQVTVHGPVPFTPSPGANVLPDPALTFVLFTLTVVNGTETQFDPIGFDTSIQSGNVEAREVFDATVSGAPVTPVLPGREVEFQVGYALPVPDDVVMQVVPNVVAYEPAIFIS
jgi:hypothetical protein